MRKVIYAIKVAELVTSGLRILNIKIGQTSDVNSTLRQYRRSNPEAKLLDLWEINPSVSEPKVCEEGVQKIAERYAYKREGEKFIFLQESYQGFAKNVNLLLKNLTDKTLREGKVKRKEYNKKMGYIGKKPKLVKFRGKEYKLNTWREILCLVASEIYKDKKDFVAALKIKGRKRVYFSKNSKELVDPQAIKGTPYFCEGNLNANYIVKIVKNLLNIFDYNEKELEIVCK